MTADLGLIDTKHKCVKDGWWKVVAIHLAALMGCNCLRRLLALVLKEEQVAIAGGWYSFIKERTALESVLFSTAYVRLSCCSTIPNVYSTSV